MEPTTTTLSLIVHAIVKMHASGEATDRHNKRLEAQVALFNRTATVIEMEMQLAAAVKFRMIAAVEKIALATADSQIVLNCLTLLKDLEISSTIGDAARKIDVAIATHRVPAHIFADAGLLIGP